jgi:hypothetical protein
VHDTGRSRSLECLAAIFAVFDAWSGVSDRLPLLDTNNSSDALKVSILVPSEVRKWRLP